MNSLFINHPILTIVIFATFIFVVGGLVVIGKFKQVKKRENRIESLQKLAQDLNFKFLGEVPYANFSEATNFKLLTHGEIVKQRFFVNVMTGAVGSYGVSIFDFIYYHINTNYQNMGVQRKSGYSHHHQTVVMLESTQINLPQNYISTLQSDLQMEGFGSRLIFYRAGKEIEADHIRAALDEAITAANLFINQSISR